MSMASTLRGTVSRRAKLGGAIVALSLLGPSFIPARSAGAASTTRDRSPFCARLGKQIQASSGAQMYCFGPQASTPSGSAPAGRLAPVAPKNVNAANPAEDISPSGARMYGQSETSTAAVGQYVVEA